MTKPLRADRYAVGADPKLIWALTEWLPYTSHIEAHEFYQRVVPSLRARELALLGCNDRYWLLTGLCHRVDAVHPWIYERAREVEADPDGRIDLWARYHYKSSVITFAGILQEILIDPEIRVCIFSNTDAIARPFLGQLMEELETNDGIKAIYGDVVWQNPKRQAPIWSLENGIILRRQGNPRECTVEAHGLINALPTGKHFPLLVYDDVINERNVTSPEQIKKATERTELSFACGIGGKTRKWFIGTRYHFGDSYAHLIERTIAKPRIYPATEDGRLDGEPVFMTPRAWEAAKREMRSVIAAQMLQNPRAGTENTFRPQWLAPYWVVPTTMNVYIMGDPSHGRSKSSDRTALAVVGIDTTSNKYLLDGYCHRMSLSERWERLAGLQKKWANMPCTQALRIGYERYGMQSDEEYFEEKMRATGQRFEIKNLAWTGERGMESKAHRVERMEPDLRLNAFFLPGKVWNPAVDGGTARWSVPDGSDEIEYSQYRPHQIERRCKANGEMWRLFEPLRRLDEDGNIYDLTRVFFEEALFFPFSPRDDLVDAVSRIYDLEPNAATKLETVKVEDYPD